MLSRIQSLRHFSTRAATYEAYGRVSDVLRVNDVPDRRPGNGEILVKMLASPVNPADFNMIEGTYGIGASFPAVGGNEGVALVEEVGAGVTNVKVGDRVIAVGGGLGTWATKNVWNASKVSTVSGNIPVEYAASLAVNPCTAYRLLSDMTALGEGDVVIQNAANSMVGQCVIQIAAARGIKTINVVRERPNLSDVVEGLKQLGGDIVVSDAYVRTPEFKELIADMPKPKLALNTVGGESATELTRHLAYGGTMATYGAMARRPVTVSATSLIFNDVRLRGFWMSEWYNRNTDPVAVKTMHDELSAMIAEGKLKLGMETFAFEDLEQALTRAGQPFRNRKVVITF